MMDLGWRRDRPTTAADLRGTGSEPVPFPTLPAPARSRSARVAESIEHVENLEHENENYRAEIAALKSQLSVTDESNAILHEQIAGMEAKHAAALATMQAKLDRANEAVTAVSTLVGSSADLLMKCRRYLYPLEPEDTTIKAEAIGRTFGANGQPQEGDGG